MHVLIVEDETHLNDVLYDYITDAFPQATIDQAKDGETALALCDENDYAYDVYLLDVMLPGIDGFDVCKQIRKKSDDAVLMLSALSDEENQLKGYELGIDEFVKKPYSPKLVTRKIKAVLSRVKKQNHALNTFGDLTYDLERREIFINDEPIALNKKEWDLFAIFVKNKGIVLERETLLNKVWGYDYYGDERTLDTHIKRLRQKLGPAKKHIKTIHRVGYKFE